MLCFIPLTRYHEHFFTPCYISFLTIILFTVQYLPIVAALEEIIEVGFVLPTPVFLPGESLWTGEPGRLQSMRLQRVGHDWATEHKKHNLILHFPQKASNKYSVKGKRMHTLSKCSFESSDLLPTNLCIASPPNAAMLWFYWLPRLCCNAIVPCCWAFRLFLILWNFKSCPFTGPFSFFWAISSP